MTLSKTIATLTVAAVTLFAANFAAAQYSYSNSWETSSSWSSSWGTGPDGSYYTRDDQSSQKSSESTTIGGRTITNTEDHSQQSGVSQGYDQNGAYNQQYAQQQGTSVYTDQNQIYGRYGGNALTTDQVTSSYDNSQGLSQNWVRDGSYNQSGFDNQSQTLQQINDVRGHDAFGNRFGGQLIQEIGQKKGSSYGMGFDRYGNQISGSNLQSASNSQSMNLYRW